MNGPGAIAVVVGLLLLILPLSALAARRLPLVQAAKMAAAWVAIFAVLLLLVSQRERVRPLWDRSRGAPAESAAPQGPLPPDTI